MTWLAGVGSATIQKYLGTVTLYFLVPLSVPSVLFLVRLTRYSVLLCEMGLKSFKRSWKYGETLPNLAHVIRSGYWLIVDDWQFTDDALSCFTEQIIKVSYIALCPALFCLSWKVKRSQSFAWSHLKWYLCPKNIFCSTVYTVIL